MSTWHLNSFSGHHGCVYQILMAIHPIIVGGKKSLFTGLMEYNCRAGKKKEAFFATPVGAPGNLMNCHKMLMPSIRPLCSVTVGEAQVKMIKLMMAVYCACWLTVTCLE